MNKFVSGIHKLIFTSLANLFMWFIFIIVG